MWKLRDGNGAEAIVPVIPRLSSDDIGTLKAAAVANLGIVALPWYAASREISQGTLQRVLPEWIAGDNPWGSTTKPPAATSVGTPPSTSSMQCPSSAM